MSLFVIALLAVVLYLYLRSRKGAAEEVKDSTPAMEAWLREALELELADGVLGMKRSTETERKRLAQTLAHEPDAEIVTKIEEAVKAVEIELVRYAHESDVEATVHVRYEDGRSGKVTRRLALADVPADALADFEKKGATRVFRTWSFPWQRVRAL